MAAPIPPKAKRGVSIVNIVDDDKDKARQAAGILESRLKYIEAICEDVAKAASFGDEGAITKIKGLYKGVPPPVNSTGSVGGSRLASPGDHTHRGVTSIFRDAAAAGELIFTGAGVGQTGSTFNFPGVGGATYGTPVDVGRANSAGTGTDFTRGNHVHRGLVRLFGSTTTLGNAAGAETDLFSTVIAAATLAANGDAVHFFASGTFGAGVSADKRLRVKFGATTIFDSGALSSVSLDWTLEGQVIRTGAATQKAWVTAFTSGVALVFGPADYTVPAETLSGSVTLKLTGAGTNASDVVGETWMGLWIPSP